MLKLALITKAAIYFSAFKLLPIFLIFNASTGSNISVVELVRSQAQKISVDGGVSAYAIIEDSFFLSKDIVKNNTDLKNIETQLYAMSFLNANKNFIQPIGEFKKNIYSNFSKELVTGNLFNWSAWYKEVNQNGGGIVVDQKQTQLLIASNNLKEKIQKIQKIKNRIAPNLSGKFLLKDGLFINYAKIFIYQSLNGLKVSEAKINYKKASFYFKNLVPGGYIVAKLKSISGELIGFSEVHTKKILSPLVLNIRDVSGGLKGMSLSSKPLWEKSLYGLKSKINSNFYVESLNRKILKSNNLYRDINLSNSSDYLLGSYDSKHWPSLYFGNTFGINSLYSFSKSMITSVLYLLNFNIKKSRRPAIVFGRVSYNGKPVAGAKLKIYGSKIKPAYFDNWIPSKDLLKTSKSGLFAFVGLSSGVSSIVVESSKHSYNTKFVPIKNGKVSFIDFIESKNKPKQILSYDLFSKNFVPAKIKLLGSDKATVILKNKAVNILQQNNGENLQLFEVEAKNSDYQQLSTISFSNKNQLEIPMIRKSWVNMMSNGIKFITGSSILIGVNQKPEKFSANIKSLLESPYYFENNLVYFDKKSQIYKTPNLNTIGFIAFNLPAGIYSANLVKRENSSLKTTTKLVISEPKSVQVFKF
ncbi:MAG: hypothetical protein HAW60_02515 [Bdellovibrionales bacterium]|nr:hypothetical protein [Bdellovibrionales bacterium]